MPQRSDNPLGTHTLNTLNRSERGWLRWLLFLAVLYSLPFAGHYAGDAQIHLVYGENAAHGHWFEFNLGEKSAGVTSPGFMVLVALLDRVLMPWFVPYAVKFIDYVCWLGMICLSHKAGTILIRHRHAGPATAFLVTLFPGSTYNSLVGMEAPVFGVIVLGWFVRSTKRGWLNPKRQADFDPVAVALLAAACWLRPEGLVLAGVALVARAWTVLAGSGKLSQRIALIGLEMGCVAIAALAVIAFQRIQTGHWLPSSGLSRVLFGSQHGLQWGLLIVNTKVAERLIQYAPLTILWLAGSPVLLRQALRDGLSAGLPVLVSWLFFAAYSTALGSAHLARYLVFVMPFYALTAVAGLAHVGGEDGSGSRRAIWWWRLSVTTAIAWMVGVFGVEMYLRFNLGDPLEILAVQRAAGDRRMVSDEMLVRLGSPSRRPVVLAYQEVQVRYRLDQRFVIRSLDGRTDSLLLTYVHDGNFDHLGYLAARDVDFIMEIPNYNRDRHLWSLASLDALSVNSQITRAGLTIVREPGGFRVVKSP